MMTIRKNERLFGRTDYTLQEVNFLILLGSIPEEFIEFDPDNGITIDDSTTSFMESFPRKELGDNWSPVFNHSIRRALNRINADTAPPKGVRISDDGEVSVVFFTTAQLGRLLNINKSKLDKLIDWVLVENPDMQPFMMHDLGNGHVVSSFLLNQLSKTGVRLDKFLKRLAGGEIRFEVK